MRPFLVSCTLGIEGSLSTIVKVGFCATYYRGVPNTSRSRAYTLISPQHSNLLENDRVTTHVHNA
jgi:hypothetical protein